MKFTINKTLSCEFSEDVFHQAIHRVKDMRREHQDAELACLMLMALEREQPGTILKFIEESKWAEATA